MNRLLFALLCFSLGGLPMQAEPAIYDRRNLVAWCIVPFDGKKRSPEQRAAMLERIGIKRLAYDYRQEHVALWDEELTALKRHGIELTAWWFPSTLNAEAKMALELFKRYRVKPQLWINGGGSPTKDAAEQKARVETEAARVRPIAEAATSIGCKVALYNHGNWWGEPENQIEIIERLRNEGVMNVGIVYNFHHGHDHLPRFRQLFEKMKPYLLALNLNGMTHGGPKIMPLAQGELDLELLKTIRDSGWKGPIGLLNHTNEDAEARLLDNLEGLNWLVDRLDGKPAAPKPVPRSWRPDAQGTSRQSDGAGMGSRTGAATAHYANMPDSVVIPAAKPEELTRANGWPPPESFSRWDRSLGGPTSNRYSALTQINKGNVGNLRVAWTYHSGDGKGNIQCNPIIVDGIMYAPTAGGYLVAIDAATGREIWRYLPQTKGKRLEDAVARRGLLYWDGHLAKAGAADGKSEPEGAPRPNAPRIIFGVGNWICALDPKNGKPIQTFGKNGRAQLSTGATTCGAVFRHVLVMAGYLGDVFGYDVRTGDLLWTFNTRPAPGEPGHETWSQIEQGANCWGGMALDESRGIAYVGLGSPKPNFFGSGHLGDNLFSNCVLALDALTGKRLWHFQEVRHDIWDWDIPAAPNLVTIWRHGLKVDAVAQVTKLGNVLLLDRVSGLPIFDFPLNRVATRALPGDVPSPIQPAIDLPQPFVRQAFTMADITQRTPEATAAATLVAQRSNMGAYPSLDEAKPTLMFNIHGGAEWTGAAADPRGRLYVTANEIPWFITCYRDDDPEPAKPPTAGEQVYMSICFACHGADRKGIGHAPPLRGLRHRLTDEQIREQLKNGRGSMPPMPHITEEQMKPLLDFLMCRDRPAPPTGAQSKVQWTFGGWNRLVDPEGYPGCTPPWGTLNCIDLNTGRIAWKVPLGEYPELAAKGVPRTGQENFGGAMVTAGGLVFASGTRDKKIRAFDADSGAELWACQLPLHGTAPPAAYQVEGRQYIVLPVTGGGKLGGEAGDSYVAFALP